MRLLVMLLGVMVVSGVASADIAPPRPATRKEKSPKPKKPKKERHDAYGDLTLNGAVVHVRWSDGDSFTFMDGERKGLGTRLVGYNTLEAYGPVHRWGTWTPEELFALAKQASQHAAAQVWDCSSDGKLDGYKRLLVRCPALAVEMARSGFALAYAVEGEHADPKALAAQAEARREGAGIWAKGTPEGVVTSLHSVGEDGSQDPTAYNRVVDTQSGAALKRPHTDRYEECQWICEGTRNTESCMLYVPFKHRYRAQPACLIAN